MNNQIINEKCYHGYFKMNAATIGLFKSLRKNAKCEFLQIHHLIETDKRLSGRVTDRRITEQFISVLEKCFYICKEYDNMIIDSHFSIYKKCSFINADNDLYCTSDSFNIYQQKFYCSSFEVLINELFSIFCLIYPYNEIDRKELFENPSVRYYIDKWYNE